MDATAIQAKVYAGYAKAAQYVGLPFAIYRPAYTGDALGGGGWVRGVDGPIIWGGPVTTLNSSFTPAASGFNFEKAPAHKDVLFNTLIDGSKVEVGDYLVGAADTYFVASRQPLLPILSVRCNRTISISQAGPSKTYGAQTAYAGTTPANEQIAVQGCPASVLFDARGRATEVGLPLDLPSPFYSILLPAIAGQDIRTGYLVTDDQDRDYVVSASELTGLGWRIFAQLAVT